MGGGSSNEQKVNEVNKNVREQFSDNNNKQNKQGLNNNSNINDPNRNKQNSPKPSPKNSPRNNKNPNQPQQQNKNLQNVVNKNSPRQQQYNQSANQNIANNGQSMKGDKGNSKGQNDTIKEPASKGAGIKDQRKVKLGDGEFYVYGERNLIVSITKIKPNAKYPYFDNLEMSQSMDQVIMSWKYDELKKNWNFTVKQDSREVINLLLNTRGQVLSGQQQKWPLINPLFSLASSIFQKPNYIQQTIKTSNPTLPQVNPSTPTPKKSRQSTFKSWGQQPVDKIVTFPYNNQGNINSIEPFQEIRKFYQKQDNEWFLTVMVQQKDYQFLAIIVHQENIEQADYSKAQVLQSQKRLVQLKRQIYVNKMYSLKK